MIKIYRFVYAAVDLYLWYIFVLEQNMNHHEAEQDEQQLFSPLNDCPAAHLLYRNYFSVN